MKIALTGGNGLLGGALINSLMQDGHSFLLIDRNLMWSSSIDGLARVFSTCDCIIHCAANTDVEYCEIDIESCFNDNYLLTEKIARAASHSKIKLVFISSTGIYGKNKLNPYFEFDPSFPTTNYHKSKYLAEQIVTIANVDNLIIRTGWLFGGELSKPKNFVGRRIEDAKISLKKGSDLKANSEQKGNPSFVDDISSRVLLMIKEGCSGLFNCVNSGFASRFDYVSEIIRLCKISIFIEPAEGSFFSRKALVSENEMAFNWKMKAHSFVEMPHWSESLENYINKTYHKSIR